MTISKIAVYITLFLCFACESGKEVTPEIILPEPSSLEKILTRGSLEISTFYNTTDYYVYRGITRGFHYDLARDFAGYLGVNLRIVEVNNDIDTAKMCIRDRRRGVRFFIKPRTFSSIGSHPPQTVVRLRLIFQNFSFLDHTFRINQYLDYNFTSIFTFKYRNRQKTGIPVFQIITCLLYTSRCV